MSGSRRSPSEIALELFDCIDEKGEATKWDLIKILGNTSQFHHWIEEFLMKEGFVKEKRESRNSYYKKTRNGELFHELLKNGAIMRSLLKLSGKRLRKQQYNLLWDATS